MSLASININGNPHQYEIAKPTPFLLQSHTIDNEPLIAGIVSVEALRRR